MHKAAAATPANHSAEYDPPRAPMTEANPRKVCRDAEAQFFVTLLKTEGAASHSLLVPQLPAV